MTAKQILLYGAGGVGKTSTLETGVKHIWQTTGKKSRLITADGGGYGPLENAVDVGALEVIQADAWGNPFATFDRLSKGWWPKDPKVVASKLEQTDFLKQPIGAYFIEGLTAFGDVMMRHMRDRQAAGESIGQMDGQKLGMFKDGPKDDQIALGGNTMAHYQIAQSYLRTYVNNFRQLWPQGVELIVWTALELKAQDEYKSPVYGPMLAGKAATAACIPWFTDVLHMDVIDPAMQKDGPNKGLNLGVRKMFLQQHFATGDPTPYLAKTSVPPAGKMPAIIDPDLGIFFKELGLANARAKEGWLKKEVA